MPFDITFPTSISPTQRSAFVICPQQWFWRYCCGIRPGGRSVHLDAGAAFAAGLEAARKAFFIDGHSEREALDVGLGALEAAYANADVYGDSVAKSLGGMLGGLQYYFDTWPMSHDHFTPMRFGPESGIEFTFSVPLDIAHPDTGDPLLFGGRIDMIARYRSDNVIWVLDDKTSGSLGPTWRNQWQLDSQITAYVWAAQQFGYPAAGAIIRGLGILKTQYKTDEVMCPRSQSFIERWVAQLKSDIERMVYTYQSAKPIESEWQAPIDPDRALDKSICGMYGGCPYVSACAADDPMPWLEAVIAPRPEPAIPADFAEFFKS